MFENIVEISLTVSFVIIVLFALSKFFDKHYTVKWRYFVWLVLVVRLIIPLNMTIEQAPLKLSLPESFTENTALQKNEIEKSPNQELTEIANNETVINNTRNVSKPNDVQSVYGPEEDIAPKLKGYKLFRTIYLLGLVLFVIYHMITYLIFKNTILSFNMEIKEEEILTLFYKVKKEANVNTPLSLKLNNKIESPMVVGLTNPTLLLNNLKYNKKDLEMILKHEIVHIKRRDVWYKTLLLTARAVHWFNPFVHLMAREVCKDIELSCDAEVVRFGDNKYKRQYSEAILLAVHNGKKIDPVFSTNFSGGKSMLKKRFENIFNTKKKRKGTIMILVIVAILLTLGICISCTQDTQTDQNIEGDSEHIAYSNDDLGIKLAFPKAWKDRYIIEELDNSIEVYSEKIKDNTEWPGLLFSIVRMTGELITEEDIAQSPVGEKIVKKGNGYTYLVRMPSDLQYPPDNKEMVEEYQTMGKDIMKIGEGISLMGNKGPRSQNEGFKVVGSTFFTTEIPDTWDVAPTEAAMSWAIKEGDRYIGRINFIPYFTSVDEKESEMGTRAYVQNEELLRKAEITLSDEYSERGELEKIVKSFEIKGGPFTSVDMETAAQQYINGGGRIVFGMIEEIELKDGNPVNILIKEMEFVSDDDAPNGFKIEIVSEVPVKYPLGQINVMPLAPPNYNNYETYYMPHIKDFLENYDYMNYYYDFIVGSDGEIKLILGRYVP